MRHSPQAKRQRHAERSQRLYWRRVDKRHSVKRSRSTDTHKKGH